MPALTFFNVLWYISHSSACFHHTCDSNFNVERRYLLILSPTEHEPLPTLEPKMDLEVEVINGLLYFTFWGTALNRNTLFIHQS